MFRVLFFWSQIVVLAHAQIPVNNTLLNSCAASLVNCTNYTACTFENNITGCIHAFNTCVTQAQMQLRFPLSCYQAAAAKNTFKDAWIIVLSVISASIAIPAIIVLFKFIIKKCACCPCLVKLVIAEPPSKQPDAEAGRSEEQIPVTTLALLQSISGIGVAKAGVIFSGIVSFVSANWLFQLWQAQTTTDASCRFDTYAPLP